DGDAGQRPGLGGPRAAAAAAAAVLAIPGGDRAGVVESVSDILCAGVFPVWFRMLIRSFSTALSEVIVPGLSVACAEPDLPCPARTDAACPGFLPVPA